MAKFVELNESAVMLGLTNDQLIEMRSNGEIHGYRDGASWKFKLEEIERVKAEMASGKSGSDAALSPFDDFGSSLDLADDDSESILVSEEELGHSGESTSSTIIGKGADKPDSDLLLTADAGESDLKLASDLNLDSALTLDEPKPGKGGSSSLKLTPGVSSDLTLVPDPGSEKAMKAAAGSDLHMADSGLELKAPGGTGNLDSSADTGLGSGDLDLELDSGRNRRRSGDCSFDDLFWFGIAADGGDRNRSDATQPHRRKS